MAKLIKTPLPQNDGTENTPSSLVKVEQSIFTPTQFDGNGYSAGLEGGRGPSYWTLERPQDQLNKVVNSNVPITDTTEIVRGEPKVTRIGKLTKITPGSVLIKNPQAAQDKWLRRRRISEEYQKNEINNLMVNSLMTKGTYDKLTSFMPDIPWLSDFTDSNKILEDQIYPTKIALEGDRIAAEKVPMTQDEVLVAQGTAGKRVMYKLPDEDMTNANKATVRAFTHLTRAFTNIGGGIVDAAIATNPIMLGVEGVRPGTITQTFQFLNRTQRDIEHYLAPKTLGDVGDINRPFEMRFDNRLGEKGMVYDYSVKERNSDAYLPALDVVYGVGAQAASMLIPGAVISKMGAGAPLAFNSMYTVSGFGDFVDNTSAMMKDKGYSDRAAMSTSMGLGMLYAGASFHINKLDPTMRILNRQEGKVLADSLWNKIVSGGALNALQEGLDYETRSLLENASYSFQDPKAAALEFWNATKQLPKVMGYSAAVGSLVGLADGVTTTVPEETRVKLLKYIEDNFQLFADGSFNINEALNSDEFKNHPTERKIALKFLDAVMNKFKTIGNQTIEEAYATVLANHAERKQYEESTVMFSATDDYFKFSDNLSQLVASDEFGKSFGKKPASVEQLMAFFKQRGVKAEALLQTGVDDLLRSALEKKQNGEGDGKVSGKDIIDRILKTDFRIETLVKGGQNRQAERQAAFARLEELRLQRSSLDNKFIQFEETKEIVTNDIGRVYPGEAVSTYYARRYTPTTEAAKELLDEYTKSYQETERLQAQVAARFDSSNATSYNMLTMPGPHTDYKELLLMIPKRLMEQQEGPQVAIKEDVQKSRYGHWDEDYVLAHMRFSTRVTTDGTRSLFLEEMQSDWAQEAEKEGTKEQADQIREERMLAVDDKVEKAEIVDTILFPTGNTQFLFEYEDGRRSAQVAVDEQQARRMLRATELSKVEEPNSVDRPPFLNSWHELLIKHAIQYAVRNGHDRVIVPTRDMMWMVEGHHKQDDISLINRSEKSGMDLHEQKIWQAVRAVHKQLKLKPIIQEVELRGRESIEGSLSKGIGWDTQRDPAEVAKLAKFKEAVPTHAGAFTITDELRQAVEKGMPLFSDGDQTGPHYSGPRAAFYWIDEIGKGFIKGLENPNPADMIHEFGHLIRKAIMTQEQNAQIEQELGVEAGLWTRDHEEKFAKLLERWVLGDGFDKAMVPVTLRPVFDQVRDMMKSVYKTVDAVGVHMGERIPEKTHALLRSLFLEDSSAAAALSLEIQKLEGKVKFMESEYTKHTDPGNEQISARAQIKNYKQRIEQLKTQLDKTTANEYRAGPITRQQILAESEYNQRIDSLNAMPHDMVKKWYRPQALISHTVSIAEAYLGKTRAGQLMWRMIDDMEVFRKQFGGPFNMALAEVRNNVDYSLVRKLAEPDANGYTQLMHLLDPKQIPEDLRGQLTIDVNDPKVKQQVELIRRLLTVLHFTGSKYFQTLNVMRKMPSGDVLQANTNEFTLPRLATEEAFQMSDDQTRRYAEQVAVANNIPMHERDTFIEKFTDEWKETITRKFGFTEGFRTAEYVPQWLMGKDGKPELMVLHSDPLAIAHTYTFKMGTRFAMIKYGGQQLMKNFFQDENMYGRFFKLFNMTKQYNERKYQLMSEWADESGLRVDKKTLKGLEDAFETAGMEIPEPSVEDMMEMIANLDGTQLFDTKLEEGTKEYDEVINNRTERLKQFGKDLGGVDSSLLGTGLANFKLYVNQIKQRLLTKIEDNIFDKMMDKHALMGGDRNNAEFVLKTWQGIPVFNLAHWDKGATELYTAIITSMKASLSAIPNIFQAGTMIRELEDYPRVFKAWWSQLVDPYQRGRSLFNGSVNPLVNLWFSDSQFLMQKIGRSLMQVSTRLTGNAYINQFNNHVAETFITSLIKNWKIDGTVKGQANYDRLKYDGRLTDEEINSVQKGQWTDHIENKLVQNFVASTQGQMEASHRRGLIELDPRKRLPLGWLQGYGFTMTRRLIDDVKLVKNAFKSGDKEQFATGLLQIGVRLTALAGMGAMSLMTRNVVKQQPMIPEDDSWWDVLAASLMEVQLFGFYQQAMNPFREQSWTRDAVFSTSPHLGVISSLFDYARGQGKFSDFPLVTSTGMIMKENTPAVGALLKFMEYNEYPLRQQYDEVYGRSKQWAKKQPWYKPSEFGGPLDYNKYNSWLAVSRNDPAGFMREVKDYIKVEIEKTRENKRDNPTRILADLKQSLMSKRPIPFGEDSPRRVAFLKSLDKDDRIRMLKRDIQYKALVETIIP